jgi:hypothetical protein
MVDIASWCAGYNWNQNCCKCIAAHESGGNSHAVKPNYNGTLFVGILPIPPSYWPACNNGNPPC